MLLGERPPSTSRVGNRIERTLGVRVDLSQEHCRKMRCITDDGDDEEEGENKRRGRWGVAASPKRMMTSDSTDQTQRAFQDPAVHLQTTIT